MKYRQLLEKLQAMPDEDLDTNVFVLMTKYGECIPIRDADYTDDHDLDEDGEVFILIQ